jgi:hypothetical protein
VGSNIYLVPNILIGGLGPFPGHDRDQFSTLAHPALPLLPPPLAPPNCGLYWLKEAPRTDQNCQKPGEMRMWLVDNVACARTKERWV